MDEQLLSVHKRDLSTKLLPLLVGRVFHITTHMAYARILVDGMIKSNKNEDFECTFGQSENSYFRKRGCVSVFDFRSVTPEQLEDALSKYYFLNPSFANNQPVFLFLNPACFERLVPWSRWKDEQAFGEMVIPYVEAGYPDDIHLALIDAALRVEVDNPPSPLELAIRAAHEEAG